MKADRPIFFNRNRVYRSYIGGALLPTLFGGESRDDHFPEEWMASRVESKIRAHLNLREGISRIEGTDICFDEWLNENRSEALGENGNLDVLVKVLDSSIRLAVQAHPDRAFSEKYFNSTFGKTEAWLILATREDACIWFGFKDKMTKEEFKAAVEKSENDLRYIEQFLNRIPVKPGDVFLIPAKMVHAVGAGCMILETQEPTDFTLSPELYSGEYKMNDFERFRGLPKDTALDCFDYGIWGEAAVNKGRKAPKLVEKNENYTLEALITKEDTPAFTVSRYTVKGKLTLDRGPAVYMPIEGTGEITCGEYTRKLQKGDYFFLPYGAENAVITADEPIAIAQCLPPKK